MRARVLVCLLVAILPLGSWAQIEARLDTARASLGDPLLLQLKLTVQKGQEPLLPDLAQVLQGFAVEPLPMQVAADGQVWTFRLRPLSLKSDRIPPIEVGFMAKGDTVHAQSQPLALEVVPLRGDDDSQLRDIKPPWEVPGGIPLWLAVALVVLVLAGLAVAAYWWLRKRRTAVVEKPLPPPDYAAEFARIAALGLVEAGRYKEYYTLLSETLRRFLEDEVGVEALEHTTSEIAAMLQDKGLGVDLVAGVEAYLNSADLVKFARFDPGAGASEAAVEGRRLVIAFKKWMATARAAVAVEEAG